MSRAEALLDRLDKVRRTGQCTWLACCPAHDDRTASLSIRETDDCRILIHCFAGCSASEVVAAIGMDIGDLFAPREGSCHVGKPLRRPFPASDALRAVASEAFFAAAACVSMAAGEPVDRDRLMLAASRIGAALCSLGIEP
jgi:hypothetical protein